MRPTVDIPIESTIRRRSESDLYINVKGDITMHPFYYDLDLQIRRIQERRHCETALGGDTTPTRSSIATVSRAVRQAIGASLIATGERLGGEPHRLPVSGLQSTNST